MPFDAFYDALKQIMLDENGLKKLLERTVAYQQFQKRIISSKNGAFTERRVKDAPVRFQEAIIQEKTIRILIEHVNNQQCPVQLSSQTTDNSTLAIDGVRDVSQIQSFRAVTGPAGPVEMIRPAGLRRFLPV